ncbi:ROK family protein [Antribacter sp. KLBMP9083]|uniref:ROK family protein n=1 Tax=Antribacter soli TaxID=2910976 RepID=A0AA41U7A5_9MICO|nr:ROK family protein [Antribacter soli]MCF4121351.1 ROK family protein [Antribacter soli]
MSDDQTPGLGKTSRELARQVLVHGPISRADLGNRLDLSPASLTRLSRPFLDRGIFVEAPATAHGAHRPAKPLDVHVDAARFIGVKITGDTAYGVITNLRATPLADASRALTSAAFDDIVAVVASLADELDRATAGAPVAGLGVTIGGHVTDDGVVTRATFLGWHDVPLAAALEAATGLPTCAENDVTALTIAQQWFGELRDAGSFAVVTVGAGVGYGLVIHDRVIKTPNTGLGLGGHIPLVDDGPPCFLGHPGCSTAMLASPSIAAHASQQLGRTVGYGEVLDLAGAGDPTARSITDTAGRALGRLLSCITNLAMVDSIVLAGDGIALWDLAAPSALAQLTADRDPQATPVHIVIDPSGFTAWARGAAAVAITRALDSLRLTTPAATLPHAFGG